MSSVEDMATLDQAFNSPEVQTAAQAGPAAAQSLDRFTEVICGFTMTD